jgi:hypothetical protein
MKNLDGMLNKDNYQGSFDEIAYYLLNCVELVINNQNYELAELEFYYYSDDHKDCSVIGREKNVGELFFHSYGLDICFSSNKKSYGGILIRSLYLAENKTFIHGPKNCLLNLLNSTVGNTITMELIESKECCKKTILKSIRIKGICLKDSKDNELYRYIFEDCKLNIDKNGTNDHKKKTKNLEHMIIEKFCRPE